MPKSWMTLRIIIVAIICLTVFEGCGSSPAAGMRATPSPAVITPSQAQPTPTRIPAALFPTTPPNPAVTLPPFTPLPTVQLDSWQGHWLKGVPCKPPCWENITPGKTTVTEAKKRLEDSGLALTIVTKVLDMKATRGEMSWRWKDTLGLDERAANEPGYIYYNNTDLQLVDIIEPYLYVSYRFSDVIKAYGEPDYIIAQGSYIYPEATSPSFSVRAVYLKQGFMVGTTAPNTKPLNVDANTVFVHVSFFIPSAEGFSRLGLPDAKSLVKWQGFKDFAFYCRNYDKPAC